MLGLTRRPTYMPPPQATGWIARAQKTWLWLCRAGKVLRALYRSARWTGRKVWTHRRMAAPLYLGLLLLVVAFGLHQAGPRRAAGTAAILWVIVGGWVAWRVHRNAIAAHLGIKFGEGAPLWVRAAQVVMPGSGGSWRAFPHTVAWAWGVYLAAGTWFVVASGWTPGTPMFPGIWILLLGGSGRSWWTYYRVRPIEALPLEEKALRWSTKVALKAGPIPGSILEPIEPIVADDGTILGCTAEAELDDEGHLTCADIANQRITNRVALIYRTNPANIALEPTETREAHRIRWWWFQVDPLEKVIHWKGPDAAFDPQTGLAQVGRHRDAAVTRLRFYRAGFGVVFQTLIGSTGAGKSETENMLLAIERQSPFMVSLVIDPQRGQSLPDWVGNVHGFAKTDMQGLTLLRAVRAEAYALNEYLANVKWTDDKGNQRTGVPFMDPLRHNGPDRIGDRDLPVICLTVAEAGKILAIPEAVELLEEASEMFRKCGILLRIDIQGSLLDQWRSRRLRKMMFGGTVILFRSSDPLDQSIAFGQRFAGDPTSIPAEFSSGATTAGMAYMIGAGTRASAMRFDLCENAYELATAGDLTPWTPLSKELRDWLADEPGVRDGTKPGATVTLVGAAATDQARILEIVLAAEEGQIRTGQVATAAGVSMSAASTALDRLAKSGELTKRDRGLWGPPAAAEEQAAS